MSDTPAPPAAGRRRRRKPWQPVIDWLYTYPLPGLFAFLLRLVYATLRWEVRGREHLAPYWDAGRPVIVGCWHGRLLLIPPVWNRLGRGNVYVLMGRNRNGELITRIVSRFRMKAIRGGSSSGGEAARQRMLEVVRQDPATTLALTPDGPRGPRYVSHLGMAQVSRQLDIPVVWVSATARWCYRVPTWDRFLAPLPFSRVVVEFMAPIHPGDHAELDLPAWRDHLDAAGRRQLLRIDRETGALIEADRALLETGTD